MVALGRSLGKDTQMDEYGTRCALSPSKLALFPQKLANYAWAGGTHNVWRRWVTLAGPDWAFQDEPAGTNTTPIDDTFCTIVSGAVSVVESEVLIP